jgi:hypothetical protein
MAKPINTKILLKFSSGVPLPAGTRFFPAARATPLHYFRLLTDPTISKQKHFNHFKNFHTTTIKMAPTKEYALLCLENPLLGMCQFSTSIEAFHSHLYGSTKTVQYIFSPA